MPGKKNWTDCTSVSVGSDYTEEELEFLQAIDAYKRDNNRPYPTWREVLIVLKQCGWEKVRPRLKIAARQESCK